jgi:bacteriorhodopsin
MKGWTPLPTSAAVEKRVADERAVSLVFLVQRPAAVFAGLCLAGGCVLAALMGLSSQATASDSWSCALSAAVCAVATVHYIAIYRALEPIKTTQAEVGAELGKSELRTDGYRYSDWLVTLPLLTLDLAFVRDSLAASGVVSPVLSGYWLALMQAGMVAMGAVWRFWFGEGNVGSLAGALPGAAAFLASLALFVAVLYILIDGVVPANLSGAANEDAHALLFFALVWIAYPATAGLQAIANLALSAPGEYSPAVSAAKAVVFAGLDVAAKAGLAVYAAQKVARV